MFEVDHYPLEYFNAWLSSPIVIPSETVIDFLNAVDEHAIAADQTAPDYFMPSPRWRNNSGRFRIYGENQDTFFCFVNEGLENTGNPSVYFESCLDLRIDYGISPELIIDGDHVCICNRFCDFIAFALARYICLRMDYSDTLNADVTGIVFTDSVEIDDSFSETLVSGFPAGFVPYFRSGVICIPDWGAAFLDHSSRFKFIEEFNPSIEQEW